MYGNWSFGRDLDERNSGNDTRFGDRFGLLQRLVALRQAAAIITFCG